MSSSTNVASLDTEIDDAEILGRRIFGKAFKESEDGEKEYRFESFFDDRLNSGLSVDRLGKNGVQKRRCKELLPLCDAVANQRKKPFVGWATIQAKSVRVNVKARITGLPAIGEENPYHAEIDRSPYKNVESLRAFAFLVRAYSPVRNFVPRGNYE